jgi:hypothetical protein
MRRFLDAALRDEDTILAFATSSSDVEGRRRDISHQERENNLATLFLIDLAPRDDLIGSNKRQVRLVELPRFWRIVPQNL